MGDSACLMQPFSYAAGFPNEANEENPINALGHSISFGRFMSESLSWEKWSTFSHKRYVEEAERYARPGSVAEKKAFFEAHYKKMAAKKAAALLEQANTASGTVLERETDKGVCTNSNHDSQAVIPNNQMTSEQKEVKEPRPTTGNLVADVQAKELEDNKVRVDEPVADAQVFEENSVKGELPTLLGKRSLEKPLLKKPLASSSKDKLENSLESAVREKASKIPSAPPRPTALAQHRKDNNFTPVSNSSVVDSHKKMSTPKSIYKSIASTPARELNKLTSTIVRKFDGSRVASTKALKDCKTPLKTPNTLFNNVAQMHPSETATIGSGRDRTPLDTRTSKSKTVGSKWRFLSRENKSHSPLFSTPFRLRTEERAARRKEKLEEKFNANEAEKVQLQTKIKKKAETELRKLRQSFCFRARPLPDFYKERAMSKNENDAKVSVAQSQSPKVGKKSASCRLGKTSQRFQRPSVKKSGSKHIPEKNCADPMQSLALKSRVSTHENTSPNIQQG